MAKAEVEINDALIKKIIKARSGEDKLSWPQVMEQFNILESQINPIRKRMRELSPESVQNSGPAYASGDAKPKKATSKKSSKKKTAAKPATKKSSKKAAVAKSTARRPKRAKREEAATEEAAE